MVTTVVLLVFPSEGIPVGFGQKLILPNLTDVLTLNSDANKNDNRAAILQELIAPDTVQVKTAEQIRLDSLNEERTRDSLRRWQLQLHYPAEGKKVLYPFFEALNASFQKPIRILHYGDSQIESDRITGYLRRKLQSKFGGSGPGLIPPIPLFSTPLAHQEYDDNWEVFRLFMERDDRIEHRNFGPMLNFASIYTGTEPTDSLSIATNGGNPADSIIPTGNGVKDITYTAKISLSKSNLATLNIKDWRVFKTYFNPKKQPFVMEIREDSTLVFRDTIIAQNQPVVSWKIQNLELKSLTLTFTAVNHFPEILNFSIEGLPGIWVDNIPMRGAGGTAFREVSSSSLTNFYSSQHIPLLILQFGGNALYGAEDEKALEYYGRHFEKNINYLKQLIPSASVIVIGPSDISVKKGVDWETHPFLEKTRDLLKKATHNAGGVYWDSYEAMGGKNSMPYWVKAEPSLAATDHIHFSPQGARKIADWFYTALMSDYEKYIQLQGNKKTVNNVVK